MSQTPFIPTAAQIRAAANSTLPDVIAPNLRLLLCGINPGLYTAAVGHHFARPGNRFWPAMHAAGFTSRLTSPFEERVLLTGGYGITNVVARATAAADELSKQELIAGGEVLVNKLRKYRPAALAVIGIGAFRVAFGQPKAKIGEQAPLIPGVRTFVLPNPSGLNAHYTPAQIAAAFREVRLAVDGPTVVVPEPR